jgi:hypothetical protein
MHSPTPTHTHPHQHTTVQSTRETPCPHKMKPSESSMKES